MPTTVAITPRGSAHGDGEAKESIVEAGLRPPETVPRSRGGHNEYLVQWENCSYLQATWEPQTNLLSAQSKLTQYHAKARKVEM